MKWKEKLGKGEAYASDNISVDDWNAVGFEKTGDSALARCNSTSQSHDSHFSSSSSIRFSCSVRGFWKITRERISSVKK